MLKRSFKLAGVHGNALFRIISIVLIFSFTHTALAIDGVWVMGNKLNLNGQSGWNYYNGGDAPEGSYMGWMYSGTTSLAANIRLPRTLQPGRYYGFVKLISYTKGGKVRCGAGISFTEVESNNDDWNKYWTTRATFDVSATTDTVTVTIIKTAGITETQKYLLRGIYITPNASEDFTQYGADRVATYNATPTIDNSPDIKGNLIPDGSFEAGLGNGWGFLAQSYYRDYTVKSLRTNQNAHDGSYSLKWITEGVLYSRVYRLRANRTYTLSMWVLAPGNGGKVWIDNPAFIPPGYPTATRLETTWNPSPQWQRVVISGILTAYPNQYFQIGISTKATVMIDSMQLEEGALTNYSSQNKVEVGLSTSQVGNILYEDENPAIIVHAVNTTSQGQSPTLHLKVYDHYNRKVAESQTPLQIAANGAITQQIPLNLKRGIFRAMAHIESEGADEELSFSVVQRPPISGADPDSMLGIHPNFSEYQLTLLQRLGIKQARVLSPAAFFRWGSTSVEPTEGNIIWYDTEIDRARAKGFEIIGTIGTNNYWPIWADNGGMPDLNKWETFVERIVTHYNGRVKYWEIWNEPIYTFTPTFYAELSKRAAAAIRRADSNAIIVGMGGTYSLPWIQSVITALGANPKQYFDLISTHQYPVNTDPSGGDTGQRAKDFRTAIIEGLGVDVWNTETGNWCEGFYKGDNSNYMPLGEDYDDSTTSTRFHDGSYYRAEWTLENFLLSVGNGMRKYFYYDSRIYAAPNYLRSHPTLLEYDDSVRAKGVAYTSVGKIIDHAKGLGDFSTDSKIIALVFERNNSPLLALWSTDGQQRQITLGLSNITRYDEMGNQIATNGSTLLIGRMPTIITSSSATVAQAQSAASAIVSTSVADTISPNLSIDVAQRGVVKTPKLFFRWIAHDEVSIPFNGNQALTYSYKIEGLSSIWSSWNEQTMLEILAPPPGTYRLLVRAKDVAGNVTEVASEQFSTTEAKTPSAPNNLRVL